MMKIRFKRREGRAELEDQLAGEIRMTAFLWNSLEHLQDRLFAVLDEQHDWRNRVTKAEAEAYLAEGRAAKWKEEVDDLKALWHPPTVEEAFAFAEAKLNPDYKPIPRTIQWSPASAKDPIGSENPLLGEQPPFDAVFAGSLDMCEGPPIPIQRAQDAGI